MKSSRGPRPISSPVHTWLIAYDVMDDERRVRLAKLLEGHGRRVQRSVFECRLNSAEFGRLRRRILNRLELEFDQVRYYPLCGPCSRKVEIQGYRDSPPGGYYVH